MRHREATAMHFRPRYYYSSQGAGLNLPVPRLPFSNITIPNAASCQGDWKGENECCKGQLYTHRRRPFGEGPCPP